MQNKKLVQLKTDVKNPPSVSSTQFGGSHYLLFVAIVVALIFGMGSAVLSANNKTDRTQGFGASIFSMMDLRNKTEDIDDGSNVDDWEVVIVTGNKKNSNPKPAPVSNPEPVRKPTPVPKTTPKPTSTKPDKNQSKTAPSVRYRAT